MDKPNILLITTDQQRFDTISALGNTEIYTPHLNWLVDESTTFTNCYSACPICMPARSTIMTGKQAENHGLTTNTNDKFPMRDNETFPSILVKNGYQTRAEGKLHFNPMRTYYGIEHADLPIDYFNECRRLGKASTRTHGIGENEVEFVINTIDERDTLTHWIVDKSVDFIENRDITRAFFLWTSFTKPHPPLDPLLSYWKLYENMCISSPIIGDWSEDFNNIPKGFYHSTSQLSRIYRLSNSQKENIKRAYYACITQTDYNLGILFARLRELNLLENTWIIFTSDHGEMLGDHHMSGKSTFFEGSSHVPMILKAPSKYAQANKEYRNIVCNKMVTLADIMPTILDICNISYGKQLDGMSLLQVLNEDRDRVFYGNSEDTNFAIIKNGYKYMWCKIGGEELMFDLNIDAMEQHNILNDNKYLEIKKQLKLELLEYVSKTSPQVVKDNEFVIGQRLEHLEDIVRHPGFNTTIFPRDTLH